MGRSNRCVVVSAVSMDRMACFFAALSVVLTDSVNRTMMHLRGSSHHFRCKVCDVCEDDFAKVI